MDIEKRKQQARERSRAYREKFKDNEEYIKKRREYARKYYETNKEKIKQAVKNYRINNNEKKRECDRIYREKNAEKLQQYRREYVKRNKKKIHNLYREYYKKNRKTFIEKEKQRRRLQPLKYARYRIRFEVMKRDEFKCTYCGRTVKDGARLTIDHVVPLSRGGQREDINNLVTACLSCNIGKRDILLDETTLK